MSMRRTDFFIVIFVSVQLALPLHYYLFREDPGDERFAWRMFSDVRMTRCSASFLEGGEKIDLRRQFQMTWINLVSRRRGDVIDAVARRLCEASNGAPITLRITCPTFGGGRIVVEDGRRDLCRGDR